MLLLGTESEPDFCKAGSKTDLYQSYCPYKYAMEKFGTVVRLLSSLCANSTVSVNLGTVEKEQVDPTVYCILTAKSKIPGKSLTDFCAFTPRWCTSTNTFR